MVSASTKAAVIPATAAETLDQVLLTRARATPERSHIHLRQDDGRLRTITYGELLTAAQEVGRGLAAQGLERGQTVALMLPTSEEFFFAFLGTLLAGGIPVPIYPPVRADQIEEYAQRQTKILRNAEVRALITFREAKTLAHLLRPGIPSLTSVTTVGALRAAKGELKPLALQPTDTALIQYTSGSTGEPKGVVLSHSNVVHNVRAIGHGVQVRPDDVTVCWLPLYHDMGLIGCWLFSLYFGLPVALTSPLTFLRRPKRWLWMIHEHRGTLSPAPNFAYELCVRKVEESALAGLDLSSWRVALNGAEPISAETLMRFTERYQRYGFRPETLMPVYGLAECSVAVTFAPLTQPPRVDAIRRRPFIRHQRAEPAPPDESAPLRFVSVGKPLVGNEVRIVDADGNAAPERVEGRLLFRGLSAMQGYYRNPEATNAISCDGWYDSGDLAYQADGELYITGRSKDVIIKAGHNIYPQELEEIAGEVSGIRRGCVAAFGAADPQHGTERIVMVAETREANAAALTRLHVEVVRQLAHLGHPPDELLLVPPQTIPKTPSGKLRRDACRRLYLSGDLTRRRPPAWWQFTRLALKAAAVPAAIWLSSYAHDKWRERRESKVRRLVDYLRSLRKG